MSKKIKVLVVDDSSFIRLVLGNVINETQELELAGMASNGLEALEMTKQLQPDVALMDITMEEYDGLYAIRRIMEEHPVPIVVLSGLSDSRPEIVFEALAAGACDFIHKPQKAIKEAIRGIAPDLVQKIVQAARVDGDKLERPEWHRNTHHHTFSGELQFEILAVGASTGGPRTIETLVQMLPGNLTVPVVIAQHMPVDFIRTFAARLDNLIELRVKVAEDGERLEPGVIYLCGGHANTRVIKKLGRPKFVYTNDKYPEFNFPSVDCLFESVAACYGAGAIGLVLTGMGKDGANGMVEIHAKGGLGIAQDEATSVVFGMPKAAIQRNSVDVVLPLGDIAGYVVNSL